MSDNHSDDDDVSLLDRRNYLKLSAAAAATLTGASATASAQSGTDDYAWVPDNVEIITLDPYEQVSYDLSPGETVENLLIDQRAYGSMFSFRCDDNIRGWQIRNVGWWGAPERGVDRDYGFHIRYSGDGEITNCFIDGRNHDGDGPGGSAGWAWAQPWHDGEVTFSHNFVAGMGNNGDYHENAGRDSWADGGGGTVRHVRSYHRDNCPSNFRPGTAGSEIVECVSIANDPEGLRGHYPGHDTQLSRAVWAWNMPDIHIRDSAIWWDPDDVQNEAPLWIWMKDGQSLGDHCILHVENCDINQSWDGALVRTNDSDAWADISDLGHSPSIDVLGSGVPTNPVMAASGDRELPPEVGTAPGGGHSNPLPEWQELRVEALEGAGRVLYEISVNGDAKLGDNADPANETISIIDGEQIAKIDGVVLGGDAPGVDNFHIRGDIVDGSVDGQARVILDGEVIHDPTDESEPDPVGPLPGSRTLGHYFPGSGMDPTRVPFADLTDAVFHSAHLSDGEPVIPDGHHDPLVAFAETAREYDVTAYLQIGGYGVDGFEDALSDPSAFAEAAVSLADKYDFGGIAIDWEYPDEPGQLATLLAATRREIAASETVGHLGVSLTGNPAVAEPTHDAEAIAPLVDYALIMCYDFSGGWSDATGHNAAFRPSENEAFSVQGSMDYWSDRFPAEKLLVGIPFYGRKFGGVPDENNGYKQPFESESPLSYDEIRDTLGGGYTVHWDDEAQVPFAYSQSARSFISFEDPESARQKATFARERYKGVGVWSVGHDPNGTLLDAVSEGGTTLPHYLVVRGDGDATSYSFSIDGEVFRAPDLGAVEADGAVDGGSVTGSVDAGDADGFRFGGTLRSLQMNGPAWIKFNDAFSIDDVELSPTGGD